MDDIVLVTADSVRRDFVGSMPFISSFDVRTGVTAGHYTRPSLAGLLSSSLSSAIQSRPVSPTVAEALSAAGYTCIGLAPTAQVDPAFGFDAGFEHYENFFEGAGNPIKNRRGRLREYLGQFVPVRNLYRRFFPMEAFLDSLPLDDDVIDLAVETFNAAPAPRFLWVHLMESHRPYGVGDDAVPRRIDRKAETSGSRSLLARSEPTPDERDLIETKYRDALSRVDARVEGLYDSLDGDPLFAFTSDHGDELGEEGYYYHQGYRRRVPETVITVPVAFGGLDPPGDRFSLLDVGPTLLSAAGVSVPGAWHGKSLFAGTAEWTTTIAPWHDRATVAWSDGERTLVARDADVSLVGGGADVTARRAEVSDELAERLQELGYMDAG